MVTIRNRVGRAKAVEMFVHCVRGRRAQEHTCQITTSGSEHSPNKHVGSVVTRTDADNDRGCETRYPQAGRHHADGKSRSIAGRDGVARPAGIPASHVGLNFHSQNLPETRCYQANFTSTTASSTADRARSRKTTKFLALDVGLHRNFDYRSDQIPNNRRFARILLGVVTSAVSRRDAATLRTSRAAPLCGSDSMSGVRRRIDRVTASSRRIHPKSAGRNFKNRSETPAIRAWTAFASFSVSAPMTTRAMVGDVVPGGIDARHLITA